MAPPCACRPLLMPSQSLWHPRRIRGRRARPASSGKPSLLSSSLSGLAKEGGPGDRSLLPNLAESSHNCVQPEVHWPQAMGSQQKSKVSQGLWSYEQAKWTNWPGIRLCVGFLIWRPHRLGCPSDGEIGNATEGHWTLTLSPVGKLCFLGGGVMGA